MEISTLKKEFGTFPGWPGIWEFSFVILEFSQISLWESEGGLFQKYWNFPSCPAIWEFILLICEFLWFLENLRGVSVWNLLRWTGIWKFPKTIWEPSQMSSYLGMSYGNLETFPDFPDSFGNLREVFVKNIENVPDDQAPDNFPW